MRERQTPEQLQVKQTDILKRLESSVDALRDSAAFRRYLSFQGKFHHYSFANTLMILLQRPNASQVAGYRTWAAMGRQVKKGEKGIAIFVPHFAKGKNAEGEDEQQLVSFGTGYVFDVKQTDGPDLPTWDAPTLTENDGDALFDALARVGKDEGLTVRMPMPGELRDGADGFYRPHEQTIVVRIGAQRQMTMTLAHELGHHMHLATVGDESATRAERETVAEAVGYVVCSHFGLETGEASFPYLAFWAKDKAVFRTQLATIQRVSATIIDRVETLPHGSRPTPPSPDSGPGHPVVP